MRTILFFCMLSVSLSALAQRQASYSLAVTNNNTAFPFSRFSALFSTALHPGIETGYGFNWKMAPHHDWYQTFKAGYFYHRFVQHAIPIYTQLGYRYKFGKHLGASAALGAGYLHSIPTTAVLKRDSAGNYSNGKGIGRSQTLLNFTVGVQYGWQLKNKRSIAAFFAYQQQVQAPFVKSYVPLLPYNNLQFGFSFPLTSH